EVGEGIFFAGLKHVAIKTIASYTEDQIITSDPSQLLEIKKAKEAFRASQANQSITRNQQPVAEVTKTQPSSEMAPEAAVSNPLSTQTDQSALQARMEEQMTGGQQAPKTVADGVELKNVQP